MKYLFLLLLSLSSLSYGMNPEFPTSPDSRLTPGSLCDHPDEYRYPEHIPYCNRDVDGGQKKAIFDLYRKKLGYVLDPQDRKQYKIDHYFPLCAGGSNQENNLWPQHRSVYEVTDPVENIGCQKLADGKISQKELITLIIKAKSDLSKAPQIFLLLKSL